MNKKDREIAKSYSQLHIEQCENWEEGEIASYWRDQNGVLCIKYQSGKWWHYRLWEPGGIEYW